MFVLTVICSDPDCAVEEELWGEDLDELLRSACECGCTWELLAVSEGEWAVARVGA